MRRDIDNAKALSGRTLDDSLIKERNDFINGLNLDEMSEREKTYALDRYRLLDYSITFYTLSTNDVDMNNLDLASMEKLRQKNLAAAYDGYNLSDKEKKYWQSEEEKIKKPLTLQYAELYETLATNDIYRCLLVATFWIAVVISQIFAEEHSRKTDQLILPSRLGRKQVYFAKISAGIVFTFLAVSLLILVQIILDICLLGTDGFNASMLLEIGGWYSKAFTYGQVVLIMLGIYLLSSILTAITAMVLSERFRNNIASISVIVGITFISLFINFSMKFRLISQIWNYLPTKLINPADGLLDLRLVSIGGLNMTSWQFGAILYVILGIVLVIAGKRIYCKYQVV